MAGEFRDRMDLLGNVEILWATMNLFYVSTTE